MSKADSFSSARSSEAQPAGPVALAAPRGEAVWWRRARAALIGLALVVLFSALESLQGRPRYREVPWRDFLPEAAIRTVPGWLVLAALVPAIMWLSRRVRVDRATWPVAVPIQLAAGVAFVFAHMGLSSWIIAWIRHRPDRAFEAVFTSMFSQYAVMEFFLYCALVAGLHAWHFQSEARDRALAASELQAGLSRARLDALRRQLDPHFLFNALNSISVLALQGERKRVARTLSGLGDLLRMSLDDHQPQEVTLGAELELLDRYLDIERVRFGDRLAVERQVDDAVLGALVPSLLLQPLVENAVQHGVAARRGPGRVVIVACRAGDRLHIEVRDSGAGFPAVPWREGIGIGNTRARLEHLYGEAQRFEIGAAAEGGARVTLSIPLRIDAAPRGASEP